MEEISGGVGGKMESCEREEVPIVSPGNGRLTHTIFISRFLVWFGNFRLSDYTFGYLHPLSFINMPPADVPPEVINKVKTMNNRFENDRRLFCFLV